MRKYIVSSIVTALVVGVVFVIGAHTNDSVARVFNGGDTAKLSSDLTDSPEFIAAVQAKLEDTSSNQTTSSTKGEKGDKGDTGNSGDRGASGRSGSDGARGIDGTTGTDGIDGDDGIDGTAGANGADGRDGTTGSIGATGPRGATGATGAQGPKGDKGDKGDTGATGVQGATGQAGADGTSYTPDGNGLSLSGNTLSLELDGSTLTSSASGLRVNSTLSGHWDTAYSWGNHAAAGYIQAAGQSGGQTLIGGTASNNTLVLQGNSATSGNTGTSAAIRFVVGNSGATTAMTILNNGNIGVGTTNSYGKLTLSGNIALDGEGDIFSQRDGNSNATYPVFARYWDNSESDFDSGTFLFGNGTNGWIGLEKPGGQNLSRFRVRAASSVFSGNVGITTDGSNAIVPFQFVQATGLADNAQVTSFNGTNYPVADWNPAVVGFSNGGGCSSNWSGGTLNGFKYWWDSSNASSSGNWRLNIDMSGPNDGCNSVQVMFVRKEFSSRANFSF